MSISALYPEKCVMCDQPVPQWRLGSDYCSPRCWSRHHGEMPGEYDEVDRDPIEDGDE